MCVSSTTSATRISPATHLNNKELMKQMPQLLPPLSTGCAFCESEVVRVLLLSPRKCLC